LPTETVVEADPLPPPPPGVVTGLALGLVLGVTVGPAPPHIALM
jgi:hypothetical protein